MNRDEAQSIAILALSFLTRDQILLRLFECGLLLALLFHSLNGLRIILVDFFPGAIRNEKALTGAVVGLTLAAGIPGSIVILWPFVDGRLL